MQYLFMFVAFVAIFMNYIMFGPSGSAQNATSSPAMEKAVSGASTATKTSKTQEPAPGSLNYILEGTQGAVIDLWQLIQQLEQFQKDLKK